MEHGLESLERSPTEISSSLRQSRTPEDEKAASLLLTMRLSHSPTSPRRYHCEASPAVHLGVGRTRTISLDSPLPQRIALPPVYGSLKTGAQSSESFAAGSGTEATTRTMAGNQVVAETPGSILGLMREHQNEHK
ncbi:hypothetical protein AMATHDRAFT_66538 [Amanita thiersii Skay4041]|uniref:Uncharacterized protein n=1 Tax=Amanita thiersii Skay4041 TaxID=703135 RepID=A0A2A9NJM5_9AGAR|nr:hypothetical protein AMATHDRAFT_66538 [Amanita thiersii Skay4041]